MLSIPTIMVVGKKYSSFSPHVDEKGHPFPLMLMSSTPTKPHVP